jgi:hypothetical protein
MKLTTLERQLVTQYCVRFPKDGAEWLQWATSTEAKRMLASEAGGRYTRAEGLLRRVVQHYSEERIRRHASRLANQFFDV